MTEKAKKPTKQQELDTLRNILNLRCAELEQSLRREKEVYAILNGRYNGESPQTCAQRVMGELKMAQQTIFEMRKTHDQVRNALSTEVARLRGNQRALEGILEGGLRVVKAGTH